jgi:hypothetical protein
MNVFINRTLNQLIINRQTIRVKLFSLSRSKKNVAGPNSDAPLILAEPLHQLDGCFGFAFTTNLIGARRRSLGRVVSAVERDDSSFGHDNQLKNFAEAASGAVDESSNISGISFPLLPGEQLIWQVSAEFRADEGAATTVITGFLFLSSYCVTFAPDDLELRVIYLHV